MQVYFNEQSISPYFQGKPRKTYTIEYKTSLYDFLNTGNKTICEYAAENNLEAHNVSRDIRRIFGKTARDFQNERKNYRKKRKTAEKELKKESLLSNLLDKVQKGENLRKIASDLNKNPGALSKLIKKEYGCLYSELKNKMELECKDHEGYKIKELAAEGKNKRQIAETRNLPFSKVLYLTKKYSIETQKMISLRNLSILLPSLVKNGFSEKEIAKVLEISRYTVLKYIKKHYNCSFYKFKVKIMKELSYASRIK